MFLVTTAQDNGDNTNPLAGSLRAALVAANGNPGPDMIDFQIGSGAQQIALTASLPAVTDTVTIDGTTQPGFAGAPLIELNGSSRSAGVGLMVLAPNCTVRSLVIDAFGGDGVLLEGAGGDVIQGCYIGTGPSGATASGNGASGVEVNSIGFNTIGGTTAAARNVISANGLEGVLIHGSAAVGNVVQGNYIGTDVTGTLVFDAASNALGNVGAGVEIVAAPGNLIGGTAAGAGNVISGNNPSNQNGLGGITVGSSGASGNVIQGNRIGTDAGGSLALGNTGQGVVLGADGNFLGGGSAAARNVIAAATGNGILVSSSQNLIVGNYIGTDATGTLLTDDRGNPFGNAGDGVFFQTGSGNTLGGVVAGAGNLISGNKGNGVDIDGSFGNFPTTGTVVEGNLIGTAPDGGTPLGNLDDGVYINASSDNTIGGTAAGATNTIADNGLKGVVVISGTGNAIRLNNIFGNAKLGIDLGNDGVTPNNSRGHSGPNNFENFPVLTSATVGADGLLIQGSLSSTPGTSFAVDLFVSPAADASGFGQGQAVLGPIAVTTDATGNASFAVTVPTPPPVLHVISATATDPSGNTSEFSLAVNATGTLAGAINPFVPTEGAPFSGTVATFTDTNNAPASAFTAAIAWGNGATGVGVVQAAGPAGTYTVSGTNTYAEEGAYGVSIKVLGNDGSSVTLSGTVTVPDAPLSAIAAAFSPREGVPFAGTVATFTDADPNGVLTDYTATIAWGNGVTTPGTLKANAGGPGFTVSGTNTYAAGGTYTVTVTVADAGGARTTVQQVITVIPVLAVTGADAGGLPIVQAFDPLAGNVVRQSIMAYSSVFTGGVRVAVGDVSGTGVPDIVTAPGPGGGPDIRIYNGLTGALVNEFFAYDPAYTGGVYVAAGDVNGDGYADVIPGTDAGGRPVVQVFSGKDLSLLQSFYAYAPQFLGGVRVAAADVNGDGAADIITGAGPSGGPQVSVYNGRTGALLMSVMAFPTTFTGGVYVAGGNLLGSGSGQVIVGSGPGIKPHVNIYQGNGALLESFAPYASTFTGGVRVGVTGDINGDGRPDVITGPGPGMSPQPEIFDGITLALIDTFYAYDPNFTAGVFVGGV